MNFTTALLTISLTDPHLGVGIGPGDNMHTIVYQMDDGRCIQLTGPSKISKTQNYVQQFVPASHIAKLPMSMLEEIARNGGGVELMDIPMKPGDKNNYNMKISQKINLRTERASVNHIGGSKQNRGGLFKGRRLELVRRRSSDELPEDTGPVTYDMALDIMNQLHNIKLKDLPWKTK